MSNTELVQLASEWCALTAPAQSALAAELDARKLKTEFETARQTSIENPTPSSNPSGLEKGMFWLSVYSGPAIFLLPKLWPETMRFALYDIFMGVADCFLLWPIIWVVLRARRLGREAKKM